VGKSESHTKCPSLDHKSTYQMRPRERGMTVDLEPGYTSVNFDSFYKDPRIDTLHDSMAEQEGRYCNARATDMFEYRA
jgi:hypothetical protein